jgi:hypothetical protein
MSFEPRSGKSVPGTPARSVLLKVLGSGERFEMILIRSKNSFQVLNWRLEIQPFNGYYGQSSYFYMRSL